jgi:hypothetical protein
VRVLRPLGQFPARKGKSRQRLAHAVVVRICRQRESMPWLNGCITPMEEAFAAGRMREIHMSGSMWRGPETE